MLKQLTHSGLPIYQNLDSLKLAVEAPHLLGGYGDKPLKRMVDLFQDSSAANLDEDVYDVYRDIRSDEDDELFKKYKFQYDITVIHQGLIGKERKKTSGHFHGWETSGKHSYPEVYEVLSGTALFVLQKSMNFDIKDPSQIVIDDLILVKAEMGQAVIVPPDYGHCSVNIGEGDMIFSNLAYQPCPVLYEAVQAHHGMAMLVGADQEGLTFQKNKMYSKLPKAHLATPKENGDLGIKFGTPVYKAFINDPEAFNFLGHPDNYINQIMNLLEIGEEI